MTTTMPQTDDANPVAVAAATAPTADQPAAVVAVAPADQSTASVAAAGAADAEQSATAIAATVPVEAIANSASAPALPNEPSVTLTLTPEQVRQLRATITPNNTAAAAAGAAATAPDGTHLEVNCAAAENAPAAASSKIGQILADGTAATQVERVTQPSGPASGLGAA